MYKKSKNPKVDEITKSFTGRIYAVTKLDYIAREDGTNGCIWCGDVLKSKHLLARYCKDRHCMGSAYAWSNPQKNGRSYLLERQGHKCNLCGYDYSGLNLHKIPAERQPEVDHIVPISKGGQSLGLENHQAICYTCHKIKSKADNSGPKPKKTPEELHLFRLKRTFNRLSKGNIAGTQDHCVDWQGYWDLQSDKDLLDFMEYIKLATVRYDYNKKHVVEALKKRSIKY